MDSIISLGQKNTLVEYMILSGADNRPPMLDKDLYDSWKSIMELYMQNREHGRMILESVEHGPLIWPTVEENGVIRTKKYAELSAAEKIQADCDMKATNIILQGLPADIYSLVNHHRVAKDLWERVQLLMQGTSLTKQERECKLYDAFDKFTHIKGESLHTYYLRFTQLINDMNIYKMKMEQFQVNTKFLNSLPPEWSKFVTDVKLVKDLHTSNFDQLHAYLEQHELHANEVRIMRERNQDPLAFVANQQMTPPHFNTYQSSYNNPQLQQQFSPSQYGSYEQFITQNYVKLHDLDVYDSDYDDFSTAKAVLMANLSSYWVRFISSEDTYSSTQQDAMILSMLEQLSNQVTNCNKVNKDNLIANESLSTELERYKERVKLLEEKQNIDLSTRKKLIMDDIIQEKNAQFADFEKEINYLKQTLSEQSNEKELLTKTFNVFKNESKEKEAKNIDKEISLEKKVKELDNIKAQQIRPMLYDGSVIAKETNVISIVDSKETLMLEEESRSKMLLKQSDLMVLEKKELSTVSLVNTSLKKLKYHLGQFENVVKKRITPDALTEGEWGFEHTKAVFLKEIIPFVKTLKDIFNVFAKDLLNEVTEVQTVFNQMEAAVQQYFVDKECSEIQKKQFLIENDRLFDQIISQYIMNIVVNSLLDINTSVNVNSSAAMNDSVNYVEMKFKGKDIIDNVAQVSNVTIIAPGMYKLDPVVPDIH
ncbi:hypothetical protein Tco_1122766 [Tanacetum coccineum]|uniref:Integrase, catalytic region, zinc finger, CCHC-type, peptidase aspartic, catalytic n=1 Tax=Tanacetum coccineum TaxID=301880 RepID=A0ABQ5J2J5_9ASTR